MINCSYTIQRRSSGRVILAEDAYTDPDQTELATPSRQDTRKQSVNLVSSACCIQASAWTTSQTYAHVHR